MKRSHEFISEDECIIYLEDEATGLVAGVIIGTDDFKDKEILEGYYKLLKSQLYKQKYKNVRKGLFFVISAIAFGIISYLVFSALNGGL